MKSLVNLLDRSSILRSETSHIADSILKLAALHNFNRPDVLHERAYLPLIELFLYLFLFKISKQGGSIDFFFPQTPDKG